jgi:hypothetical protein
MIVALLLCMTVSSSMANIVAPNDNGNTGIGGSQETLSIDGYVTTKFASVGSDVQILALTRGHSANTIVTADILHFQMDVMELVTSFSPPQSGVYVDTVVLTQTGVHEDDSDTMSWGGTYIIPINSLGGVYGARISAEDGNLRAIDDPTQIREVFVSEFEKVLLAIDTAWDSANPTEEIKGEFDSLDAIGNSNGGWSSLVATATSGQGIGGSQQFWDAMITAGHNQYNMSEGANFLTALMELLDSQDIDASIAMLTGLMTYANEFPLPQTIHDFDDMVDYMALFDPIENFTRFSGTEDFEAVYNAMLGSDEWIALREALDNLANNTKQFESVQTILHNIALLAVSVHPEAIADALEAWVEPLMEGDFNNMTPFQGFLVRWIEMAGKLNETTDIISTDDDDVPEHIIWEYEKLLNTTEGLAWSGKMESSPSSAYVNDFFDDFNSLPEDIIAHGYTAITDPEWSIAANASTIFGEWISNSSGIDRHMGWNPSGEEEQESIIFEELHDVRSFVYDSHLLDLGIELSFWGPWDDDDYPSQFTMSMTNNHGIVVNTVLQQDENERERYLGRLTALHIEDAVWEFTQPLEDYEPDCASQGCQVENAELRIEALRPSMLDEMIREGMDEIFVVSAVGVIVDQDETTLVDSTYTVDATSYNTAGTVAGASVDIAIVRVSPQRVETSLSQLEPEDVVTLTLSAGQLTGQYEGSDLVGDVMATISQYDEERDGQSNPQAASIDPEIEINGMGTYWGASSVLPADGGLAIVKTSGTTETGLEFEFMQEVPLPGTSGCARTEASSGGSWAHIGYRYENFRFESDEGEQEYDKPELSQIKIEWGDGEVWEHTNSEEDHREEGWESHDYEEDWEEATDHEITVTYTDEDSHITEHHFTYKTHHGYVQESEEGEYRDWTSLGWCELESDQSFVPSAEIVDAFITDGPLQVMDEQVFISDSDGKVSMTVTPTLPGIYSTIVQTKIIRDDGEVMTGVGFNVVAVTEASVELGGLTLETTIGGIPVYSVDPAGGGLTTITVTPSGIDSDEFTAHLGLLPLNLSVPFPDISGEVWSEAVGYELEFEQGDTSRSQEVRITAPFSFIGVYITETDEQIFPSAIQGGILLKSPGTLNMSETLGPGQITNISLSDSVGEASRILALAAPKHGFDSASVDLSAFTEILYREAARPNFGWIPAEQELERTCEEFDGWREDRWDEGQESNVRMNVEYHFNEYAYSGPAYNPSNIVLADSDGNEVTPTSDWDREEWETNPIQYHANFNLDSGQYTLTAVNGGEMEFEITAEEEGGQFEWGSDNEYACSGDTEMTETEIYDMFDEFFSDVNSVAWGQGSMAQLHLPILSSPQDDYTVIAVAQIGQGESATIICALDSEIAQPNPEPPVLQNLTLSFSPSNPVPGDAVQITATNDDNQPVSGLSVTLVRDNVTLFGLVTNHNGQASFWVTEGVIVVQVSGGMYNRAELTIIVTATGVVTEDGNPLPADDDGDGVLNSEDAFPDDAGESEDSDGDGVGDNADAFPYDANETMDSDGDGIGDNAETSGLIVEEQTAGQLYIIIGALVAIIGIISAIVVVVVKRRSGDEDTWQDSFIEETAPIKDNSPDGPPPGQTGEMRDGYEVLEYPENSGEWWWRDPSSGKWEEWRS